MRVIFRSKFSEFDEDLGKKSKKIVIKFSFYGQLHLNWLTKILRSEYLKSAVNVLTSSPKISVSPREIFSNSLLLRMIRKYDKCAAVET